MEGMSRWIVHVEGGPKRVNHAGVLIGNHIFSFGGYCTGANFEVTKPMDIHVLNIYTYSWSLLSNSNDDVDNMTDQVPFHRYGHTVVNWMDRAYIFGGRNDCNGACNKLYCFDPGSNKWSKIQVRGEVPGARDGHSACVINGKMYVYGGYEEELQRFSNEVHCFDFLTSKWMLLQTKGKPGIWRDFHSATPIDHLMLIFGGRSDAAGPHHTNNEMYCNRLVFFDTRNHTWSRPEVRGIEPYGRRSHAAFAYNGEMYIIGGYNSLYDIHFGDIYKFNLVDNRWTNVRVKGEGPGVRRRHCCCVAGDRVFLFGGTRPVYLDFPARTDEHLTDLSDLHVLHFKPSLELLCMLVVIENKLNTSSLPMILRQEIDNMTRNSNINRLPVFCG